MPNLYLKISTNQRPPFKVTWPQWRLLIGRNFLIADLAYLSHSKTILPLVTFWSGHYFNIFFSENSLPMPIWAILFLMLSRKGLLWFILKRKFSNLMVLKSYGVKIFVFEMLISHWSRLWFLLAVNPCDRAVNSFPKWYDTWKSAKKWGYESQISILVIFLSKPKKIKNPWLGAPGAFFGSPEWYQWTSLKVPEGFLR